MAQDKDDKEGEKKGKLKKLGEEYQDKDEDEDNGSGGFLSIWGFIDPVDLVNALANMKPGPYPYGARQNFFPDSSLPGGIVKVQGGYFQHSSHLSGILLRYSYSNKRFSIIGDMVNLFEEVDQRTDHLNIGSIRMGWDFVARPEFLVTGEVGFRSFLDENSPSGPELGMKMTALPGKPLILESEGTIAWINRKSFATYSVSLGVMIWRSELLFGGQFYRSPNLTIDGWKLGLRFWL